MGGREQCPKMATSQAAQGLPCIFHSTPRGVDSLLLKTCFAFYKKAIKAPTWLAAILKVNRKEAKEGKEPAEMEIMFNASH